MTRAVGVGRKAIVLPAVLGLAAVLVTGCGSQPTGRVIGARSVDVAPASSGSLSDAAVQSLQARLADAISAAENVDTVKGEDQLAKTVQQIANDLPVLAAERLLALNKLGVAEVNRRLNDLRTLQQKVDAMGIAQQGQLDSYIQGQEASLQQLQGRIQTDSLVDVMRTDVQSIADYRIYGVVKPKVLLMASAYALLKDVPALQTQVAHLQGQAAGNATAEQQLSVASDRVAAVAASCDQVTGGLGNVTAAGFPGNKGLLDSAHTSIDAARQAFIDARMAVANAISAIG